MVHENKNKIMLASVLMFSMVGLLVFAYKKNKASGTEPQQGDTSTRITSLADTFQDQFLGKLNDAEEKIKQAGKGKHFNLPSGEFGLFL